MVLGRAAVFRVGEVFRRADLGDPRLVRRAVGLAESLAQSPDRSLPKIWSTSAELEAAYRFLRNRRTQFESLMEAVQQATREQALQKRRVLVLHDTTDIAAQGAEPEEVGYLQTGKAGFYVHHALCVGCDDVTSPLGILWSQLWGRARRSKGRRSNVPGSELAKLKERESDRWLESMAEAQLWAEGCERVMWRGFWLRPCPSGRVPKLRRFSTTIEHAGSSKSSTRRSRPDACSRSGSWNRLSHSPRCSPCATRLPASCCGCVLVRERQA